MNFLNLGLKRVGTWENEWDVFPVCGWNFTVVKPFSTYFGLIYQAISGKFLIFNISMPNFSSTT